MNEHVLNIVKEDNGGRICIIKLSSDCGRSVRTLLSTSFTITVWTKGVHEFLVHYPLAIKQDNKTAVIRDYDGTEVKSCEVYIVPEFELCDTLKLRWIAVAVCSVESGVDLIVPVSALYDALVKFNFNQQKIIVQSNDILYCRNTYTNTGQLYQTIGTDEEDRVMDLFEYCEHNLSKEMEMIDKVYKLVPRAIKDKFPELDKVGIMNEAWDSYKAVNKLR